MNTWKNAFAVLMEKLQIKDCRLARTRSVSVSQFTVRYGWLRHFMVRHNFTVKCRMLIAQRLPEEHKVKLVSFQKYVLKLRKQYEYVLAQIGNADETPIFLTCHNPHQLTLPASEQCRLELQEPRKSTAP
jgi:hypothetical protein